MPFYAVRKGRKPGIYFTWKECEEQIAGYPYPSYRKFNTLEEAEAFIGEKKEKSGVLEVWCDGSAVLDKSAGCGIVIVRDDVVVEELAYPLGEPFTNSHGEVQGILRGISIALLLKREDERIEVNSDSEFSVKTINLWGPKRKSWSGYKYADEFQQIIEYVSTNDITVKHVRAHRGIKYNEMADSLSRRAAGLK